MKQMNIVKETARFILELREPFDLMPESYHIYIKYENESIEIANIYRFKCAKDTTMTMRGTNFQDCITSWDLFKEFIMLVDDAFERCELNTKSKVVLD